MIGHTMWHKGILKTIIEGRVEGKNGDLTITPKGHNPQLSVLDITPNFWS